MIAAEPKAVLYIFDYKGYDTLNSISDQGILEAEALALGEDFYKACEGESEFEKLPKELKISYRRVGGTLFGKDKTANEVYKVCKKLYEEIAKKVEP